MRKQDFSFYLPQELIAQCPADRRSHSRLLALICEQTQYRDLRFHQLGTLLRKNDLLVFNNTRVIPARFYGNKSSGGKIEVLLERIIDPMRARAQIRASKAPKPGTILRLGKDYQANPGFTVVVQDRDKDLFELRLTAKDSFYDMCESFGHIPLPPYVKRQDNDQDKARYQTVYAREKGAVAAPTAGLHFDEALLGTLKAQGIEFAFVTLHVGAGTFLPVRVEDIRQHHMHRESIFLDQPTARQINRCKQRGGRVIAVGTTSLRCLESIASLNAGQGNKSDTESNTPPNQTPLLTAWQGETDIFIYPGYQFKVVDALITNFHLPESTLFMLVCAFCGLERMQDAYQYAIARQYRFFSYGDAMFLQRG